MHFDNPKRINSLSCEKYARSERSERLVEARSAVKGDAADDEES
jgi:hypothetical protein